MKRLAIHALPALTIVVIGILAYQNVRLKQTLGTLQAVLSRQNRQMSDRVFRPGKRLDAPPLVDGSGHDAVFEARSPGAPHLIAVIRPDCGSCGSTADALRDLGSRQPARSVWIVSLGDAETTRRFAAEHRLEAITYRLGESVSPVHRVKLSNYPQVILVGDHGRILRVGTTVAECVEGRGSDVRGEKTAPGV